MQFMTQSLANLLGIGITAKSASGQELLVSHIGFPSLLKRGNLIGFSLDESSLSVWKNHSILLLFGGSFFRGQSQLKHDN